MAYNIWMSVEARKILDSIKEHEFEVHQKIQEILEFLARERENFITGAPLRN